MSAWDFVACFIGYAAASWSIEWVKHRLKRRKQPPA